jgi:FAD-dependent urate hydroxylase
VTVTLASGDCLTVDQVVFATGCEIGPAYLTDLIRSIDTVDGFPVLDEAFQSTLAGLYFPGFAPTRDFGPFFGFTKRCRATAISLVDDLIQRL